MADDRAVPHILLPIAAQELSRRALEQIIGGDLPPLDRPALTFREDAPLPPSPYVVGELRDFATGTMMAVASQLASNQYEARAVTEQRVWTGRRWARISDPDAADAILGVIGWDGTV